MVRRITPCAVAMVSGRSASVMQGGSIGVFFGILHPTKFHSFPQAGHRIACR
jgi:hypothetical protein